MTMPDKKTTDVKVVGVSPEVAAQVQATQKVEQETANVIAKSTEAVADDLKAADIEREAKADAREDKKSDEARAAARFALGMDAGKTIVLAFIVGIPLMITAWRVGEQAEKIDKQDVKLTSIHGWVNSGMRIQLEEKLKVAEELYMLTMDPKHGKTVDLYKEQLAEHDRQQAKQDAKQDAKRDEAHK